MLNQPLARLAGTSMLQGDGSEVWNLENGLTIRFSASVRYQGFPDGREYKDGAFELSDLELYKVLALAYSKCKKAKRLGHMPFCFVSHSEVSKYEAKPGLAWQVCSPQMLLDEAASLTLRDKAMETLVTLTSLERLPGQGVRVAVNLETYPGFRHFDTVDYFDLDEVAYATVEEEGLIVLQYLLEDGLIKFSSTRVFISPKGYSTGSELAVGKRFRAISGFLVCRFTNQMDEIYERVYSEMKGSFSVPFDLKRVKDTHHIERIDDKILSDIRASNLVVVDLSDHNFNIAFEAGFALALEKPIVWTFEESAEEPRFPFDIQSHNILMYSRNKLPEFKAQLEGRIAAAIQKVKQVSATV